MPKQLLNLADIDITTKNSGEVTGYRDSVMVVGAFDQDDAYDYVSGITPYTQYGLIRGNISLKKSHGPDTFKYQIEYNQPDVGNSKQLPGLKINFDTGGGTKHITQAKSKVKSYGADYNFGNAVKVNPDRTVEGIDIPASYLKFSETKYYARGSLSFSFLKKLKLWTNTVNSVTFRTFDPGEVLFTGASGNWDDDTDIIAVTRNYDVKDNEEAVTIDGISCDALLGWDYRWIYYAPKTSTQGLVPKAAAIFDMRLFKFGDLKNA